MKRRALIVAGVAVTVAVLAAGAWFHLRPAPTGLVLGAPEAVSAGPTSFKARRISVRGKDLGYASAHYPPLEVSPGLWVYQSCTVTRSHNLVEGECGDFRTVDMKDASVQPLKLPGFSPFWSVPGFAWPLVGYVDPGPERADSRVTVACVIYDYEKKSVVKRRAVRLPDFSMGTDVPGLFEKPVIRQEGSRWLFSFTRYTPENKLVPLCDLDAPAAPGAA